MEELSREDALRLNVLLQSNPLAIRIDESAMVVHGLSERGEAQLPLHPNCRDDLYLRRVRELISGQVLGSPGGYPVYLKRWTRMGQAREGSLDQLLLLGEPEAVVAAVHAPGLTDKQAGRAWWAMPTADNARSMLARQEIVAGRMGKILADYLVDYLPFEQEPADAIESVRLVLQPGLVEQQVMLALWRKASQKTAYLVGFLSSMPDELPQQEAARPDFAHWRTRLTPMAQQGNAYAEQFLRLLSGAGQTYLATVERVMRKPANQDVVSALFDTVMDYFAAVRPPLDPDAGLDRVISEADVLCNGGDAACPCPDRLGALLAVAQELKPELRAMLVLSRLSYGVVRPVFSHSTAIGSLMRRKLEPLTTPIRREISVLRNASPEQAC